MRSPSSDGERPVMDRWIASRLAGTVREARARLEDYDATGAGRRIEAFVDDLSNWYVRRSRRRFWNPGGEGGDDARAAFATLYRCLVTVAQLLAPFMPFLSEAMWRNLAADRGLHPDSVHLSDYPDVLGGEEDPTLEEAMATARQIVELGRRVRAETRIRNRQPLAEAVVHLAGSHDRVAELLPIVAEELNVRAVRFAEPGSRVRAVAREAGLQAARSAPGRLGARGRRGAGGRRRDARRRARETGAPSRCRSRAASRRSTPARST